MLSRQISLAASVGVTLTVLTTLFQVTALADPVQGGTYYNTPGSQTTFNNSNQNPANGNVQRSVNLQGVAANSNGGSVTAPEQVIRLNGTINTAGVSQNSGYTGNDGNVSFAPPVNSVNNGAIAQGGTYFNTADSKTTFTNTSGGGIWLQSGSNLRGLEVDALGNLTNNGGTVHFYAPGAVVRLDGNIDVRAVRAGNEGSYLGNGGKLFVDSAFLYQNGNIYANGINGGLVQFNVGAATFGGNSRIEAKGFGGEGGVIAINASGPVSIGRQTVLDSSGKVAGSIDTNLINIEGGLVNVEGNLFANGVESRGGTIRIVATGQSDLSQTSEALTQAVTAGNFTESEKTNVEAGLLALKNAHDGDIVLASASGEHDQANVYANGYSGAALTAELFPKPTSGNDPTDPTERAGDGGTVMLTAQRNIENGGWVLANGGKGNPYVVDMSNPNSFTNGGHGGTVSLIAGNNITNTGRIGTDGGFGGISVDTEALHGGNGGLMAFSYGNQMNNTGVIRGHGGAGAMKPDVPTQYGRNGAGGLAVFSGTQNLSGDGLVSVFGGPSQAPESPMGKLGTIVAPDPVNSTNTLMGVWRKTQPYEVLSHAENLILLNNHTHQPLNDISIADWFNSGIVRSVQDPLGKGVARDSLISKLGTVDSPFNKPYYARNLILGSNDSTGFVVHAYDQGDEEYIPTFLLRNSSGSEVTATFEPFYTMTLNLKGPMKLYSFDFKLGGKVNDTDVTVAPGRLSLISDSYFNSTGEGGFRVNHGFSNGGSNGATINIAAKYYSAGGYLQAAGNNSSVILKSANSLRISGYGGIYSSGGAISGGTYQLFAGENIEMEGQIGAFGTEQGGSVLLKAGNTVSSYTSDRTIDGGYNKIEARGQYGGYVTLAGKTINFTSPIDVSGTIQDGQIVKKLTP